MAEPIFAPAAGGSDPVGSAKAVGLRYVHDQQPGFGRVRAGKGFRYLDPRGKAITDDAHLKRIASLAIPPAWKNVWICPNPNGHLQATGRDDKGRKQYRYHARWREVRDETKYAHMIAFASALPRIRKRVKRDLKLPGLPRNKVLATLVQLLEKSLIRVGNEEYARGNKSYGLTTLRNHHAQVRGEKIRFHFRGKSGKQHEIDVHDPHLARIVKKCQELPGQELFEYTDPDGAPESISSEDVNEYLRQVGRGDFTAKDFRTWSGTVLAAMALQEFERVPKRAQIQKNILEAIRSVATRLGNTPAVCRKSYIHPAILETYADGSLLEALQRRARAALHQVHQMRPEEGLVLGLLQERLALEKKGAVVAQQLRRSLKQFGKKRITKK